jgi:prepilin-type N-terminal cleavage/methylation domain-containing protein
MEPSSAKGGKCPGGSPRCISSAFSLLEMMMVITAILILASFSEPYYQRIIVHGREAVLREDLFTMRVQIGRFTKDNQRAPASLQELGVSPWNRRVTLKAITRMCSAGSHGQRIFDRGFVPETYM